VRAGNENRFKNKQQDWLLHREILQVAPLNYKNTGDEMLKYDRLQAVLWDMDGVLIDSHYAHFLSFEKAFEKFGIDFKKKEYASMFGMANNHMIQRMTDTPLTDTVIKQIDREKDVFFRESFASEIRIIQGVVGWLEEFRKNGIRQAVASSGSYENMRSILDSLHLLSYFDAMSSGDECPPKPAPGVFLAAARKLDVSPDHCLVIEDSLVGVKAAAAAGIPCVAITTSYPAEQLAGAGIVIDQFTQENLTLIQTMFSCK
jgi:beta-phosphoglucomutase